MRLTVPARAARPAVMRGPTMATSPISSAENSRVLPADAVHVWRIPLDTPAEQVRDQCQLLTPAEQARAKRFRGDDDRARFQIARAATRRILGDYLGLPPEDVAIDVDRFGKPQLDASVPADRRIHFNISHSGGWILVAFARSFPVGIDVEQVTSARVTEDLIGHIMSDSERRTLQTLPQEQRIAAFFNCWTSKEALLKGIGIGLTARLQAIEVSIDPGQPARVIAAPRELCPGDWQLRRLDLPGPYAATVAFKAKSAQIVNISGSSTDRASSAR
jgi:4'-phosphopantetheinyl transferase